MKVEILTLDSVLLSTDAKSVIVPGKSGGFEMLNNHAAIVSNLKKGSIKIYGNITLDESQKEVFKKEGRGYFFDINSGTVEMKNNKVTALVE